MSEFCPCGSGRSVRDCIIHLPRTSLLVPAHFADRYRPRRWRHVEKITHGMLLDLSKTIVGMESEVADLFPDLHAASHLFVGSDYAGHTNKKAKYELFSFLIFNYREAQRWESMRLDVRQRYLGDRTMSFEGLNDRMKLRALPHFLEAADAIPGILITVAVSKKHRSLFRRDGPLDMESAELQPFAHWKRTTFEKLLRAVHFLSFFVGGLSREGQEILWYSDEDDIAPNAAVDDRTRTAELGAIWRTVLPNYTPHRIPQIIIGTEKDDEPTRSLVDTIAVPDLACGAWCELLSFANANDFGNGTSMLLEALRGVSLRSLRLLHWFSQPAQHLKRLLCVIDEPMPSGRVSFLCSAPQTLATFRSQVGDQIERNAAA
jgi:hypothetical protein